jgi:hypothetical protein
MSATPATPPAWTTRPGELLLHPVALTALGVLLVNDHLLKAQWPGLVTGKLSDVAGLVLLPLFVHAVWIGAVRATGRVPSEYAARLALFAACLLTALAFAAIKLTTLGHDVYRTVFGVLQWPWQAAVGAWMGQGLPPVLPVVLVMDAWDLLAVGVLVVPVLLLARAGRLRSHPRARARAQYGRLAHRSGPQSG